MVFISVLDEVAGTWSNPVVSANSRSAIRDFDTACNDSRSLIGQHPTDFKLYLVGEWTVPEDTSKPPIFTPLEHFKLLKQGSKADA